MTSHHIDDEISLRPARRGEEDTLAEIGASSFRDGEIDGWQRYFRDNTHRGADDTLVAEIDGRIAGHASALRLTMQLAGVDVPVRGVAAVAVAPEYRRRGVADKLLREQLRRMRARGDALAALYPFRSTFYQKLGYGTFEWIDRMRVTPSQLPPSPLRRNVRRMDRARDLADVRRVYDEARARSTGPFARSDYWWEARVFARIPEGVVYVDPATRKMAGYALYEIPKEPRYPTQHALVKELCATSPDAFRGLLGFFEAHGDQLSMVEFDQPAGRGAAICLLHGSVGAPPDLRAAPVAVYSLAGCMGRIVDIAGALALHPGPAARKQRGRVGLDLSDPVFAAQSRPLDVTFAARGVTVTGGREARERVVLGVDRFAQIYFGGASARTLRSQGLIGGSERAAALLDEAFAGPPPLLYRANFF